MQIVDVRPTTTLDAYASHPSLTGAVARLRERARDLVPRLQGRTVWMVNSTATGGGVAEMLPRVVSMLRELGVSTEWAVIESDDADFFVLTKRIHNLIHDSGLPELPAGARDVYERVSRENADRLAPMLAHRDMLVVHDPQPMLFGSMLAAETGVHAIWRCHIGLEERTARTEAAWSFLEPFAEGYQHGVFTALEYVPEFFRGHASVISPALDPLSNKSRDLFPHVLVGILCNAGLMTERDPVVTPPFPSQARRLGASGSWDVSLNGKEIGLLFRPTVVQISRWDRLKGFAPLLRAFAHWKSQSNGHSTPPRHVRRREIARLVLAGPDPSAVADDPEGLEVLHELAHTYAELDADLQDSVAIVALPMDSAKHNALMVNALQRCASVVVQNSLREGFGLTVLEAMWKRTPVLASSAFGPRQQIVSGTHGTLIRDPLDVEELSAALNVVLREREQAYAMADAAHMRVAEEFLVFRQVERWLETLTAMLED